MPYNMIEMLQQTDYHKFQTFELVDTLDPSSRAVRIDGEKQIHVTSLRDEDK